MSSCFWTINAVQCSMNKLNVISHYLYRCMGPSCDNMRLLSYTQGRVMVLLGGRTSSNVGKSLSTWQEMAKREKAKLQKDYLCLSAWLHISCVARLHDMASAGKNNKLLNIVKESSSNNAVQFMYLKTTTIYSLDKISVSKRCILICWLILCNDSIHTDTYISTIYWHTYMHFKSYYFYSNFFRANSPWCLDFPDIIYINLHAQSGDLSFSINYRQSIN